MEFDFVNTENLGAGEVAWQLRALAFHAEDQGLKPSTHMVVNNHS